MKHFSKCGVFFVVIIMAVITQSHAARWYVAPGGSDNAGGTITAPFATMVRGQTAAVAGDTVYFRGGTYYYASTTAAIGIDLTKSGASGRRINYWAYPGEIPVFDFYGMTAQQRIKGVNISASWIHLKWLEIRGVPQNLRNAHEDWGVYVNGGSNNIFELLNLRHNMGPGLFIIRGGNNLVLNCDSHDNYDLYSSSDGSTPNAPGENADGFGCHVNQAGNTGNVFRGCRAWNNSDDGFDCISCQEAVTIENCWNWSNGYIPGTTTAAGNGNGFKIGGFGNPPDNYPSPIPQHTVRFCVAFNNRAAGFYQNHHPRPNYYYNNTSYNNRSANFNLLGYDLNAGADAGMGILRNNLAFTGTAVSNGTGTGVDAACNSWNLTASTVSAVDFQSVATTGWEAPRRADGSLPVLTSLHLVQGSDLIDKGINVGLPYIGTAPDLGAFEYGAVGIAQQPFQPYRVSGSSIANPSGNVHVFDLSGRCIESGFINRACGVFIYKFQQPANRTYAYPVFRSKVDVISSEEGIRNFR